MSTAPLDIAVGRGGVGGLDAQAARDGGTDGGGVEPGALDGTRFDDLRSEALQRGLGAEAEAQPFHVAQEKTLSVPDAHERGRQLGVIPSQIRPIWLLVDIAHFQRIAHGLRRMQGIFTA